MGKYLTVNILGCFTIGLLMMLFEERWLVQPNVRLFLTVGILGGFTTFSTLSYETIEIFRGGNISIGLLNRDRRHERKDRDAGPGN
jgi:CrcB protein